MKLQVLKKGPVLKIYIRGGRRLAKSPIGLKIQGGRRRKMYYSNLGSRKTDFLATAM